MLMTRYRKRSVAMAAVCALFLATGCRSSSKDLVSSHFPKQSESSEPSKLARVSRRSANEPAAQSPNGRDALVRVSADEPKPSLREQVEPIGEKLAAALGNKQVKFYFGYLENPSPRGQHTSNGHVFVTTGMLSQMKTTDELAGVLRSKWPSSWRKNSRNKPSRRSSKPALCIRIAQPRNRPRSIASRATLLDKAGYQTVDLKAIRSKLEQMNEEPSKAHVRRAET